MDGHSYISEQPTKNKKLRDLCESVIQMFSDADDSKKESFIARVLTSYVWKTTLPNYLFILSTLICVCARNYIIYTVQHILT